MEQPLVAIISTFLANVLVLTNFFRLGISIRGLTDSLVAVFAATLLLELEK